MKNIISKAAHLAALNMAIAMLFSCEKPIINSEDTDEGIKTVTFHLMTPSVTRATAVADFKYIAVIDIQDGQTPQLLTQTLEDADFGTPTITLQTGEHQLTFLATDGSNNIINGSVLTQSPLGDTFLKTITIDTRSTKTTQRVILDRIVARLEYVGEGSVTVNGVLQSYDIATTTPATTTSEVTLTHGEGLYTYIPANGKLTMGENTITVARNAVTTIYNQDGGNVTPTNEEYLIAENDTAQIYVSKMEITGIILAETLNPRTRYAEQMAPYRMPTRREAYSIHRETLPEGYWSGTRCLAYDRPEDKGFMGASGWGSGNYYSFEWNNTSTLAKAGEKVVYSIKPIRVIPLAPVAIPFSLDADFTWSPDTIRINQQ